MKKIFNGGYHSPLLNGLKAVNCGAHFEINGEFFEAMSKEFSTHEYNLISKYVRVYSENFKKIEINGFLLKDVDYNHMHFTIAYYRELSDVQPYRQSSKICSKWEKHLDSIKNAHSLIFEGKMR